MGQDCYDSNAIHDGLIALSQSIHPRKKMPWQQARKSNAGRSYFRDPKEDLVVWSERRQQGIMVVRATNSSPSPPSLTLNHIYNSI